MPHRILIVHAHPEPASFNGALTAAARAALEADLLILQFPLWHGGVPAIMKGWFERVFAYGVTYVDGARFDTGLLRGRRAMVSVTTGGTPERFSPQGVYGDIGEVLRPVHHLLLGYAGYTVEDPFVAYAVPRVSDQERDALIDAWRERVVAVARQPIPRITVDPFGVLAKVGASGWARA